MLCADLKKHTLKFIHPGGTSRGVLTTKNSWYLFVWNKDNPEIKGVGECSILPDLSIDDKPEYETKLREVCENIEEYSLNFHRTLVNWPSLRFGLEMALIDLQNNGKKVIFPSEFTSGYKSISINGLIWMGEIDDMKKQLKQKISSGFNCIKIKIGALDFEKEIDLIKEIRNTYDVSQLEIRVDANGAFSSNEVWHKLKCLSELQIHSIEQPIKQGQWKEMAKLCKDSPLDIALDEELIGINEIPQKRELLSVIKPKYIILKPSLLGGFKASKEWVDIAEDYDVKWWVTSALEGNVGLNAIAQWTAVQNNHLPQGLGTGQVFSNNVESPLHVLDGRLTFNITKRWGKLY